MFILIVEVGAVEAALIVGLTVVKIPHTSIIVEITAKVVYYFLSYCIG